MQAAQYAPDRTGQTVLDEGVRVEAHRADHVRVEGAAEGAALVGVRRRLEQVGAGDRRDFGRFHGLS